MKRNVMMEIILEKVTGLWDYLKYVIGLIVLIIQEVKLLITGILILILLDQITGVWKALKLKDFCWSEFYKLYPKLVLYVVCIIACHTLEVTILEVDTLLLTKGASAVIGFQECASVINNVSKIFKKDFLQTYFNKYVRKSEDCN